MEIALTVVGLALVVVVVSAVATRFTVSAPLTLVVVGLVASYVPFAPEVTLSSEMVLVGFLPPLLYAAAIRTSLVEFRQNKRPIALLSVGLVIFNTVMIGLLVSWLLPVHPAAAFALGAVVAPPDAVAATSIARRVGLEWVHLRLCMTCGNVGCCDSSIGRHASAHFLDEHHPVIRAFEPGEAWRWCFVDQRTG